MMKYAVAFLVVVFTTAWAGDLKKVDLNVKGMHCENCTDRVKSAVKKVKDVRDVEVNLEDGIARVSLEEGTATTTAGLAKAIADVGFAASYDDNGETRTVDAVKTKHHDEDCDKEMVGDMKGDCMKEGKSDCCKGKTMKMKEKTEVKSKTGDVK